MDEDSLDLCYCDEINVEKHRKRRRRTITPRARRLVYIDAVFYHYLHREVKMSKFYRKCFRMIYKPDKVQFALTPTKCDLIDYKWNYRVTEMIQERCELDHALSWLSTLGGAFSALGDYFPICAEKAGRISMNQFKLALRLGDPSIASRCRLYYSLSLIQQRRFKLARFIIYIEFKEAQSHTVRDERLIKMCKGIWSKLQYEHYIHRNLKKIEKLSIK